MSCILMGCTTDFTEVKESGLNQAFILNSSPTFLGYFYLGSDKTYHYFVSKWKYERDRRFKVPKSYLAVKSEKPFGQKDVQIFTFKPTTMDTDEFGVIGQTRIYRER